MNYTKFDLKDVEMNYTIGDFASKQDFVKWVHCKLLVLQVQAYLEKAQKRKQLEFNNDNTQNIVAQSGFSAKLDKKRLLSFDKSLSSLAEALKNESADGFESFISQSLSIFEVRERDEDNKIQELTKQKKKVESLKSIKFELERLKNEDTLGDYDKERILERDIENLEKCYHQMKRALISEAEVTQSRSKRDEAQGLREKENEEKNDVVNFYVDNRTFDYNLD